MSGLEQGQNFYNPNASVPDSGLSEWRFRAHAPFSSTGLSNQRRSASWTRSWAQAPSLVSGFEKVSEPCALNVLLKGNEDRDSRHLQGPGSLCRQTHIVRDIIVIIRSLLNKGPFLHLVFSRRIPPCPSSPYPRLAIPHAALYQARNTWRRQRRGVRPLLELQNYSAKIWTISG